MQASICEQGIDARHLRALAALTQLKALNLSQLHWTEDAVKLGLGWLAARLPRLRVLHAPTDVLVRPWCLPARCVELRKSAEISRQCEHRVIRMPLHDLQLPMSTGRMIVITYASMHLQPSRGRLLYMQAYTWVQSTQSCIAHTSSDDNDAATSVLICCRGGPSAVHPCRIHHQIKRASALLYATSCVTCRGAGCGGSRSRRLRIFGAFGGQTAA